MNNQLLARAGELYLKSGLSVIPIAPGKKKPWGKLLPVLLNEKSGEYEPSWLPYQQHPPTIDELHRWIAEEITAIGFVCGRVSGGAEVLDFDVLRTGGTLYESWLALTGDFVLSRGLPVQRTGSGGYQVGYRCAVVEGNAKLAFVPDAEEKSGRKTAIETRGEGGYVLITPSLHPSGRRYELIAGRFSWIPTITPEERAFLWRCARQLNQVAEKPKAPPTHRQHSGSTATSSNPVIDAYNQRHSITEALQRYGYTEVGRNRWSRPGKADSASVELLEGGKAYSYSSNDLMDGYRNGSGQAQPFGAFDLYATYEHQGDYKAAVKAAAVELGMEYKLHTLIFVEKRENAAAVRAEMFKRGWVARYFERNKLNTEGIDARSYENIIVWAYDDWRANSIAAMIPGAYPLVVPQGLDAQAMAKDGILRPYLEAVLADAKAQIQTEVCEWTL